MQQDEQAIRELIDCWIKATAAGDTETVLSLMADDVVFLIPGHLPMRGKAAFASAQGALQGSHIEGRSEIQEIQVCGDWAYCWTHLTVEITPPSGGDPVKRSGETLSILRKQPGGAWRLYRDANLLASETR